ncbi:MAG: NAD-dependent epimerase/dehydratase family protein [Proteobacteria bacterium]|nr:NAD-dependent epimerase/dehydratase family protein [Pseudomonadota bacterium]
MTAADAPRQALVTGGAGFIGSHVVDLLVASGSRVVVLDDLSTGRESNLRTSRRALRLVQADVCDEGAVQEACQGVDVVFHLAAMSSVSHCDAAPERAHAVNVEGTQNVLAAARRQGVPRLVFAGSAAVYGEGDGAPQSESRALQPGSLYARQKLAGEQACRSGGVGIQTVALRYFNVFGPRQRATGSGAGVVARFLETARQWRTARVFGDGGQLRDFVYVADAAAATVRAGSRAGEADLVANVGCGRGVSIDELVRSIREVTGRPLPVVHGEPRPGEIRASVAAVTRLREGLGYRALISLREGLRRTWAALQESGARSRPSQEATA